MQFEESLREIEILAMELDPLLALDEETSVRDVIDAMRERRIACAVITRDERLAGVFTDRDVLRRVIDQADVIDQPVGAVMTRDPVRVQGSDPIATVITHMHEGRFRHVPVVDADNRVVGCVGHRDLGRFVMRRFADRVLNLPPDPEQVAAAPEGG